MRDITSEINQPYSDISKYGHEDRNSAVSRLCSEVNDFYKYLEIGDVENAGKLLEQTRKKIQGIPGIYELLQNFYFTESIQFYIKEVKAAVMNPKEQGSLQLISIQKCNAIMMTRHAKELNVRLDDDLLRQVGEFIKEEPCCSF